MQSKHEQQRGFPATCAALTIVLVAATGVTAGEATVNKETQAKAIVFDSLKKPPAKPWKWIRENPDEHRSSDRGLEIKIQPGSLMGGGKGVKNIFVRPLPKEAKFVSIHVSADHKEQYQQAGLIVYRDDDSYVKLVLEMVDGQHWFVFIAEVGTEIRGVHKVAAPEKSGWISVSFEGDELTAHTWSGKGVHREIGVSEFPMKPRPQIGVFTHGGKPEADRWAQFRDFGLYEKMSDFMPAAAAD